MFQRQDTYDHPRPQLQPPLDGEELERLLAQRLAIPVAVSVALFTFTLLRILHHFGTRTGTDFRAVMRGAADLAAGHNIYAPALRFLSQGHLRDILSMPVTPYVYPPPLALLMRPLTYIPPATSQMLWEALNVSLMGVVFVLVVRLSAARTFKQLALAASIYGFFPVEMGLGTGQIDLVITLLALLSYLSYRGYHPTRAGVLLGVMTLIKPTVGAILLFFLIRRAWRVLTAWSLAVAVGLGVSLVAVGGSVLWEYRTVAEGWANAFGVLPLNESIHGLVSRLLAPARDVAPTGLAASISLGLEVALLVAAALLCWRLLRHGEPATLQLGTLQFYASFSILLVGIPFTENIHLSWLLPGIGLLFLVMSQQRRWRPWHFIAVSTYLIMALPFAEYVSWHANTTIFGRLSSGMECYGLIGISAVLCYVAFSQQGKMLTAFPRADQRAGRHEGSLAFVAANKKSRPAMRHRLSSLVGARGFEPPTF